MEDEKLPFSMKAGKAHIVHFQAVFFFKWFGFILGTEPFFSSDLVDDTSVHEIDTRNHDSQAGPPGPPPPAAPPQPPRGPGGPGFLLNLPEHRESRS